MRSYRPLRLVAALAPLTAALGVLFFSLEQAPPARAGRLRAGRRQEAPPSDEESVSAESGRETALATIAAPEAAPETPLPVTDEAEVALETEPAAAPEDQPAAERAPRRGLRSRLLGWLFWLFWLALVFGGLALAPRILGWALDSPRPLAAVAGESMWPALKKGDLVVLKGVDGVDDLKVGDIIAYRHNKGLAIHRIVGIEGEEILTQGDANLEPDGQPITIDDVIGKVPSVAGRLAKAPYLGHLSLIFGPVLKDVTVAPPSDDDSAPAQQPEEGAEFEEGAAGP